MRSQNRRAAARRRAWGRGPTILRFESLEGRELLSTATGAAAKPDMVATAFDTLHNLDWGDSFHAVGTIQNQGSADALKSFTVDVYASTSPVIGPGSVKLGSIEIPGGLAAGATAKFDKALSLPVSPLPGDSGSALSGLASSPTVYVGLRVDPNNVLDEGRLDDKEGLGQGFDTSAVTITPHKDALLIGTSFGVTPDQVAWGGKVTVTAQVSNNSQGDAPATRARIVLTPAGATPGGTADVTIGNLSVPAIPAFRTVNVSQQITLPAGPPTSLAGATSFTISMVQDADNLTNQIGRKLADQGLGLDSAAIAIAASSSSSVAKGPVPDLTLSSASAPTLPLVWGQNFQVKTTLENLGKADAGPIRLRFLLADSQGNPSSYFPLGDSTVDSLKAGFAQDVVQTLRLPTRGPNGQSLASTAQGIIIVQVDPENTIDESNKANNQLNSGPITLQLLNTDGTVSVPVAQAQPSAGATQTTITTTTAQTTQTTPQASNAASTPTKTTTATPGQAQPAGKTVAAPKTPKATVQHPAKAQKVIVPKAKTKNQPTLHIFPRVAHAPATRKGKKG